MLLAGIFVLVVAWLVYNKVRDERHFAYWRRVQIEERDREIQRLHENSLFWRHVAMDKAQGVAE